MKVQIVKYLTSKGKILEMRKDHFKGSLPKDIIEEYEVEIKSGELIKTNWLEDLEIKYVTGNYILLWKANSKLKNPIAEDYIWTICKIGVGVEHWDYKLIHNKHKDIIEAYLKNPSVEIETGMFAPMTGETEPSKWVDLEKDFIEDYNEEFWYRLKVKDLAWYEDKNMIGKMIYDGLNREYGLVLKVKDNLIETSLGIIYSFSEINIYKLRPATEAEALSLVYKPQQKVSKEKILVESNRLKDLFLNNKAECLVENEQEFRLVYNFLDKTRDKSLNRYLKQKGSLNNLPILINTSNDWGNIYEWSRLKNRDLTKPLIKFDGETFWEVIE